MAVRWRSAAGGVAQSGRGAGGGVVRQHPFVPVATVTNSIHMRKSQPVGLDGSGFELGRLHSRQLEPV